MAALSATFSATFRTAVVEAISFPWSAAQPVRLWRQVTDGEST